MICKEDIISWFKESASYKRIDVICNILNMCIPFELRFIGTFVEEIGKQSYNELRGAELKANNPTEFATECAEFTSGLFDGQFRRKITLYLSLLHSSNQCCAKNIYDVLTISDVGNILSGTKQSADGNVLEELLLLYTMALNHPAFTFEQQTVLGKYLTRLLNEEKNAPSMTIYPDSNQSLQKLVLRSPDDALHMPPPPPPGLSNQMNAINPMTHLPAHMRHEHMPHPHTSPPIHWVNASLPPPPPPHVDSMRHVPPPLHSQSSPPLQQQQQSHHVTITTNESPVASRSGSPSNYAVSMNSHDPRGHVVTTTSSSRPIKRPPFHRQDITSRKLPNALDEKENEMTPALAWRNQNGIVRQANVARVPPAMNVPAPVNCSQQHVYCTAVQLENLHLDHDMLGTPNPHQTSSSSEESSTSSESHSPPGTPRTPPNNMIMNQYTTSNNNNHLANSMMKTSNNMMKNVPTRKYTNSRNPAKMAGAMTHAMSPHVSVHNGVPPPGVSTSNVQLVQLPPPGQMGGDYATAPPHANMHGVVAYTTIPPGGMTSYTNRQMFTYPAASPAAYAAAHRSNNAPAPQQSYAYHTSAGNEQQQQQQIVYQPYHHTAFGIPVIATAQFTTQPPPPVSNSNTQQQQQPPPQQVQPQQQPPPPQVVPNGAGVQSAGAGPPVLAAAGRGTMQAVTMPPPIIPSSQNHHAQTRSQSPASTAVAAISSAAPNKATCWNCGEAGHTGHECTRHTMDEITRQGNYHVNFSTAASHQTIADNMDK